MTTNTAASVDAAGDNCSAVVSQVLVISEAGLSPVASLSFAKRVLLPSRQLVEFATQQLAILALGQCD